MQLRKFSKGMVQRVGIAQALVNEPDVVFFDEPMSGLDPLGRRDIRELILRLRARGCTVFFSSHVLSDAEALCSRVAILAGGRLVATGRLSEIQALEARGWDLVVSGLSPHVLEPLTRSGRVLQATDIGARPLRAGAAGHRGAARAADRAGAGRRAPGVGAAAARQPGGLLRAPGGRRRQGSRAGGGLIDAHAGLRRRQRVPRVGARQGAVQPGRLRRAADGGVVSHRPADGRPGHQDHQGPRPGRHRHVRADDRGLHRHRPGVEGSGAPQHLRPADQADQPGAVHRRQVCRPGADAGRERGGDGGGVVRRARLHGRNRQPGRPRRVGGAGHRPDDAEGRRC